jgi:hypothetical protein
MKLLWLAMEDSSALEASRSASTSTSTDSFVDFIPRIIARGAEGRNWPAVKKMTGGESHYEDRNRNLRDGKATTLEQPCPLKGLEE